MPRWEPIHPDFVRAIWKLDSGDEPYAELWRRLRPVAWRLDHPRPSYWAVRKIAMDARRLKRARREELLDNLVDVWTWKVPRKLRHPI